MEIDYTKKQTKPTTVREYAFDLLPDLCRAVGQEKRQYVNNTDAISAAIVEFLERRHADTEREQS